ncbi:MAG TPA: zf-HC2 domain-containing protein [Gemmatimonadaceae bacterium]|nr:zf-HC2 domain-containing protein [Gemmatimonadaceae bacterium]
MQHLDEGTIHAWLDGALGPEEAARVEAHVGSCSMCADAVAEARGLIAASSRILTALDDVPSVRVSPGPRRARPSLTTWLVREKIAAVMTLVVAGGALALALARDTPDATHVDLVSQPVVAALEIAVADSPAPPPAPASPLREEASSATSAGNRPATSFPENARDLAANREADSAPPSPVQAAAPRVMADAVAPPVARIDDSVRMTVAQAERQEAVEQSSEAKSSVSDKIVGGLTRRRAAEAPSRFAERPAGQASSVGAAAGAAVPAEEPRLVHEEKMLENGREVRRRIYRVGDLLVTLDERAPAPAMEAARAGGADVVRIDSATATTVIRWTSASGAELTLTGPTSKERLERIRRLLGYE